MIHSIRSVSGELLWQCESENVCDCLEKAPYKVDFSHADLTNQDLSKMDLSGKRFSHANFTKANLRETDFYYANLSYANLSYANLSFSKLKKADLSNSVLEKTDFSYATLTGTDFTSANLKGARMYQTNLTEASFSYADLKDVTFVDSILKDVFFSKAINIPEKVVSMTSITPEGKLIGWKKCMHGVIVKLAIPENAKRSNATSRKCRAEFVEVLEVSNTTSMQKVGISVYNGATKYKEGEIVQCHEWDENRWLECGGGIHFFLTKLEAEDYPL